MLRQLVLTILLLVLGATASEATPQFSLLTGNRCVNCHVAPSGGGLRNDLGWYSYYDVGMIERDNPMVSWMYSEDESNTFLDGKLTLGMDLRVQSTRSFASPDAERVTFPMQASLYGAFRPIKAMTIEGQFNLAALRKSPNSDERVRFPGQRMGLFSLLLQPDLTLPMVRVGFFRPSIGVRYDDHTMFPYVWVSSATRQNYLAPDWGEWGSELTWESEQWLTVNLGIFGSEGLSQVRLSDGLRPVGVVNGNDPTITGRVVVWPKLFDDAVNGYAGGSVLINNDFRMISAFLGGGLTDHVYVMFDLTQVTKEQVMQSTNIMTELGWNIWSPLILYGRYEVGTTTQEQALADARIQSIVLGAQAFVLPYVELRPEYRIWDTALPGSPSRWNVQLNIFY